jgi:APA family basic amino acid/polyamine antiporter
VISAALLFYIVTVAAVFRLRRTRPNVPRPYRTWGYPLVPLAYIVTATTILVVLLMFRPTTTWPGFVIVLAGLPVYWLIRRTKTDSSVLAAPDAAES